MDIKHSRRILAIGHHDSGVLDVIKALTGSAPPPNPDASTAGLTHEWTAKTPYYTAQIPIWIDEVSSTAAWTTEFLKPEAKEVVQAVGAWIYCFRPPTTNSTSRGVIGEDEEAVMSAVQEISEAHAGFGADVVMLAVAVPRTAQTAAAAAAATSDTGEGGDAAAAHLENDEEACMEKGFEFIDSAATGKNQYGEKTGLERLKEALEANEWADGADIETGLLDGEELDDFELEDDFGDGFGVEEAEMTAELFGVKAALAGEEGETAFEGGEEEAVGSGRQQEQVEDLDRLMSRLLAVKEQSADLPEAERKRMAARAVRDLMQEG